MPKTGRSRSAGASRRAVSRTVRKESVIFLVGPTAAGKTACAVALAKKLPIEVISCDSMQVYKGMNVASQAPSAEERKAAKHYLVGAMSPSTEYSASVFAKRARRLIKDIAGRGKVPVVVGGSGLYVKALVDGLFPSPAKDPQFRAKMWKYAARHGSAKLYERLAKTDAGAARTIHPNDSKRIIRALEVYHATGKPMSALKAKTQGIETTHDVRMFGLSAPRERLYRAVEERVERMFADGLLGEVKRLSGKRLGVTASRALGIQEVAGYLGGEYSLEEAKRLLKRNTRHFVKNQLTWFCRDKRIEWFDVSCLTQRQIVGRIVRKLKK
ncbi:MAG: tRNA (adenosine(37)-N6)-dimethylallyltransferase MiaA [Candidatus Omnitrophota bacterium]